MDLTLGKVRPTISADSVDDFTTYANEHYPRIHRAALLLSGTPWDADDLAQETFVEAMAAYSRFQARSGAYTWLYAILLNRVRQWKRRQARWAKLKELAFRLGIRCAGAADRDLQVREWRASLWAKVAGLSIEHQEVLLLRFSEGLTYEQMAEVVGVPPGTVKSRVHYALSAMRQRVRPEDWLDQPANEVKPALRAQTPLEALE